MVFNAVLNKSSFLYWYPKIEGKIRTPKSIIVTIKPEHVCDIMSGNKYVLKSLIRNILYEFIDNNMQFPVFFKTDTYSAKWYWSETCFINDKESLEKNILNMLSMSQEDDDRPVNALIFKEYVMLEGTFTAFNCMPVSKERRYFIEGGKVLCHHSYWNVEDMEFFNEAYPSNWEAQLKALNVEDVEEVALLTKMAERFAELIDDDGYFSVDFAKNVNGVWYLIDSSEGDNSYHDENCPVFKVKVYGF